MSKFEKGDRVMAVKDLGGMWSGYVRKGAYGVIVDGGGWLSDPQARFPDEDVTLSVDTDDVSKV